MNLRMKVHADLEWISTDNGHLVATGYQRLHYFLKHKLVAE
jgi:hypothetical protein